MSKTNVQIRVDDEMVEQIDKLAPKTKSEFVRQAIQEKIQRETFRRLEEQWIQALKEHPEGKREADEWLKAESWGGQ